MFELTVEECDGYLRIATSGTVSMQNIERLGGQVREVCERHGINNVVIDCRGMKGALTVGEMYAATPKFVNAMGQLIRAAYINPPPDWIPEDDKFSRNVAYNRGGNLELFASEEDAVAWFSLGTDEDAS